MAGNTEIKNAFRSALKAGAFLLPIHWKDTPYTPKSGTPYLEEFLLPAETATPTMGDSLVRAEGIYQINCVYPNGKGDGDASRMADKIVKAFKRGTTLTAGGIAITTTKSWASPEESDSAWIRIAISIRYFSYITP